MYVRPTSEGGHITDEVREQEHYTGCTFQPIDVIRGNLNREMVKGFYLGNIIKYIFRFQRKDGLKDLQKAKVYLDWLIELLESEKENTEELK